MPAPSPVDAIVAHHAEMAAELRARVDRLAEAAVTDKPVDAPTAAVVEFITTTLLPHAASEESTLYATAARFEKRLIDSLVLEHGVLRRLGAELPTVDDRCARVAVARVIAELFVLHATKENEFVLPTLVEHASGDISTLLHSMHHEFERHQPAGGSVEAEVR